MKEKARHGYLWQERVRLNGSSLVFLFHQATFRCIWKEMTAFNLIPGLYPSADIASGHCLCHSASHGNVQYCSASMGFRRSVLSSVSFYTNTLWLPLILLFVPYSSTKLVWKHFCLIWIKKQNISSRKNKGPENLIGNPLLGGKVTEKELETIRSQLISDMVTRIGKVTLDCPSK